MQPLASLSEESMSQSPIGSPVTEQVRQLYNTYPFPPAPLSSVAPPGWNWRWSWPQAYAFCTGSHPGSQRVRILDAGCGSGVGTEYIAHQNPTADLWAFDLSERALQIAQSRCAQSNAPAVNFQNLDIVDVGRIPGQFQFINCVGVLHHLKDPTLGLQLLAEKLAPGGIMHIFVYGELGRWEIRLMQEALRLLVTGQEHRGMETVEQLAAGLQAGRQLFEILPDSNRIQKQEKDRWATENVDDECFADMYLHPREVDYSITTLFQLIERSGLQFLGFSNPEFWRLERVLGSSPDLLAQAHQLDPIKQYRLIELLDPVVAHYEFFVGKPPLPVHSWDPESVLTAVAHLSPCITRWPSQSLFNYRYEAITLSDPAYALLQAVNGQQTVGSLLTSLADPLAPAEVLQLVEQGLLLLEPPH